MSQPAAAPAYNLRFRASGVSVSRGGVLVVRDISLDLEPGDAAILRGPNGAGKTTLLRALAGLLRKDAGTLTILPPHGTPLEDANSAMVYCGPLNAVKPSLTVDENLRFWAALYGAPQTAISEARAALGLDDYAERRAGALSTGYCRRLGLARLLLSRKAIWLTDEPSASLDAASVGAFEAIIEAHRRNGGIAVIATHEPCNIANARKIELIAGDAA